MEEDGNSVSIDNYEMTGWWTYDVKDLCEEFEEALEDGGSGTMHLRKPGSGHGLTVTEFECDEETGDTTVTLRDPNQSTPHGVRGHESTATTRSPTSSPTTSGSTTPAR